MFAVGTYILHFYGTLRLYNSRNHFITAYIQPVIPMTYVILFTHTRHKSDPILLCGTNGVSHFIMRQLLVLLQERKVINDIDSSFFR